MSKNYLSGAQIRELKKSKHVLRVSKKSIKYTEEFKECFYQDYQKGLSPREIIKNLGIDPDVLTAERIYSLTNLIKKEALRIEGFTDKRSNNLGRQGKIAVTVEERLAAQELQIRKLNQKVEFLKKNVFLEEQSLRLQPTQKKRKKNTSKIK